MKEILKKFFWKMPISKKAKNIISQKRYERILRKEKKYDEQEKIKITKNENIAELYLEGILKSYNKKSSEYKKFQEHNNKNRKVDLVAYYLTQYHPNKQNDEWWGKGVTEWNNVNQAIPQFVGHYQPRKPGELGYYDLRIKENMKRQIELAKNYGVNVFCYYYYWFDGKRLLEYPLDLFLKNKDLDMKFFFCWANENWTRRFSGTNEDVLMKITPTEDNYKEFINNVMSNFEDKRYYKINGKPVISIYRPSLIPNPQAVLKYWRKAVQKNLNKEIYIIAVQEKDYTTDWMQVGFDAETEFQPKQIQHNCKDITNKVKPVRKDFSGKVYDYEELVKNKKYIIDVNLKKKVYPAVMPMWDNTARRNFRGTIYHNSSPTLYKEWLCNAIKIAKGNKKLEKTIVFINAWNEWGEGAYLEPDDYYGYAYLEATYQSIDIDTEEEEKD